MDKTSEFVKKARAIHGDTYDYTGVAYTQSKTKVDIRCRAHNHTFQQTPNNHLNGQGCPLCGKERRQEAIRSRRSTRAQFLERSRQVHKGKFTYNDLPDFVAAKDRVGVVCPEHGVFEQQVSVHLAGHGCTKCAVRTRRTKRTLDPAKVIEQYRQAHPTLEFLGEYLGMRRPLRAKCLDCGLVFERAAVHFRNRGCPACGARKAAMTPRPTEHLRATNARRSAAAKERFLEWVDQYKGPLQIDKDSYKGWTTPLRVTCPIHGERFMLWGNLLAGHGCGDCNWAGPTLLASEVEQRVLAKFNGRIIPRMSTYVSMSSPMQFRCREHGLYTRTPKEVLSLSAGCTQCVGNTSRYERELSKFLDSIGVEHENNVWGVLRSEAGHALEIDLWVPELQVGIEIHGLHWHADCEVKHLNKWRAAQKVGVRLIQIFEDEWRYRREAVENRLRAILGKAPRVYARKLYVEEQVGRECEAAQFLAKWHTQGVGRIPSKYYVLRSKTP